METEELRRIAQSIIVNPEIALYNSIVRDIDRELFVYGGLVGKIELLSQLKQVKSQVEHSAQEALNVLSQIRNWFEKSDIKEFNSKSLIKNPFNEDAFYLLNRIVSDELSVNADKLLVEIAEHLNALKNYINFPTSIASLLEEAETPENDELIVVFEGKADVKNLKELSDVSNEWYVIVNCFGRLTKENNTDVEIVSIAKGSLILVVNVALLIINAIVITSGKIQDVILKSYEIKKKSAELKQMKLDYLADAIELLEKKSALNLDSHSKSIVDQMMHKLGWSKDNEQYHETETAALAGVKKMIKFQSSGGKVDAKYLKSTEEQMAEVAQLRDKNNQVLSAEKDLARLSEGSPVLQIEEGGASETD